MSKAKKLLEMLEPEVKWDLYIQRKGEKKPSKANKKPMSLKELEDMMDEFKKSGIEIITMDSKIVEK